MLVSLWGWLSLENVVCCSFTDGRYPAEKSFAGGETGPLICSETLFRADILQHVASRVATAAPRPGMILLSGRNLFLRPQGRERRMRSTVRRGAGVAALLVLLYLAAQPQALAFFAAATRRRLLLLHRSNAAARTSIVATAVAAAVQPLSTGLRQDLPDFGLPEFGFIGASNVGKSSLLNCISGSRIARTSKMPGRTQAINLFRCSDGRGGACVLAGWWVACLLCVVGIVACCHAGSEFVLVSRFLLSTADLPGYGFANIGKDQKFNISKSLEEYLASRPSLQAVFVLFDIRRGIRSDDEGQCCSLLTATTTPSSCCLPACAHAAVFLCVCARVPVR